MLKINSSFRMFGILSIVCFLLFLRPSVAFSTKAGASRFFERNPARILLNQPADLDRLVDLDIIIDDVRDTVVTVYISPEEFETLSALGYDVAWIPKSKSLRDPDSYPDYNTLEQTLALLAANNPGICRLIDGGQSVQGRTLYWVKISDNVDIEETSPKSITPAPSMETSLSPWSCAWN